MGESVNAANTFTLRIYFAGLQLLVQRKTRRDVGNGSPKVEREVDELLVLLPNLTTRERIRKVIGSNDLKVHQPAILYQVRNRVGDVPRYPLLHDDARYLNGLWLIEREDLQFVESDGDPFIQNYVDACGEKRWGIDIRNCYSEQTEPHFPTKVNCDDTFWISPLRAGGGKVAGTGLQRVRPNLVDDEIIDLAEDVAGRMVFRAGKLKNAGFAYNPETEHCHLFDIGGVKQAIATLTYVEITGLKDRVYLKAEKFPYETPSETLWSPLILEPAVKPGTRAERERIVEICLVNLERDEFVQFNPGSSDEEEIRKLLHLEHGFLLRMLESGDQPVPPDFEETDEPVLVPGDGDGYLIQHPPWRRWLMPGRNGQTPSAGGNCKPNTAT